MNLAMRCWILQSGKMTRSSTTYTATLLLVDLSLIFPWCKFSAQKMPQLFSCMWP
uniref:Uncharacterized protein n=1 Tax=Rhizophora mucronata TaxID=61149 RepID=A0A2P2JBM7_RHIMU